MRSGDTEHKPQLLAAARQRAFGTYLRYGRMPQIGPDRTEQKAIDPQQALAPAGAPTRPTRHYVWHTIGDERVRSAHALNNGRIFAWANPPQGGHPGTEPNCRCWPVPYFGDPQTPDALQPLTHSHQVDTSATGGWSSIEMLTRPDGSVAESVVVLADGTQVRSTFRRTLVARRVTLASGDEVRIETDSGVQTVTLGDDKVPLFQSAWTPKGPVVVRARQRVAFLLERGPFWPDQQLYADPGPTGPNADSTPTGAAVVSAAAQALLGVYAAQQTAPASQGLAQSDVPYLALRAWVAGGQFGTSPILADALGQDRARKFCELLPEVQGWTDEAAAVLATDKPLLSPADYGKAVHLYVKRQIEALKEAEPTIYAGLWPEYSVDASGVEVSYGKRDSTRLDVLHLVPAVNPTLICIYEVKTGDAAVRKYQLDRSVMRMMALHPNATVVMIQVKPNVENF
jgi:hypothetical protein